MHKRNEYHMCSYIFRPFCCCHSKKHAVQNPNHLICNQAPQLSWLGFLRKEIPSLHQFVIQKQRNIKGEQQHNGGNDLPVDSPPRPNLTDQLLGSSSVLQALGRQLAPITASAISPASSTTSTIAAHNTPL